MPDLDNIPTSDSVSNTNSNITDPNPLHTPSVDTTGYTTDPQSATTDSTTISSTGPGFSPKKKLVSSLLALVLVVGLGTGGFFAWQKHNKKTDSHAATSVYRASACGPFAVNMSVYGRCLDKSAEAQMTRMYLGIFNRQPDGSGLNYWSDQMVRGKSLYSIASYFATSTEFKRRYPNASNTTYVTALYKNVLDRTPDSGGLNYWVSQLNTKRISRAQVLLNFTESSENVRSLAADIRCFASFDACTSGLIAIANQNDQPVIVTNKKHLIVGQSGEYDALPHHLSDGTELSVKRWAPGVGNQVVWELSKAGNLSYGLSSLPAVDPRNPYFSKPVSITSRLKDPSTFKSPNISKQWRAVYNNKLTQVVTIGTSKTDSSKDIMNIFNKDGTLKKSYVLSYHYFGNSAYSWSPDDRYILYTVYQPYSNPKFAVGIVDTTNGSNKLVSIGPIEGMIGAPSMSSQGKIAAADGTKIYIANRDGTGQHTISKTGPSMVYPGIGWSPDGSQLVYDSKASDGTVNILHIVDASNGSVVFSMPGRMSWYEGSTWR